MSPFRPRLRGRPRPDEGPAVRFARGISLGALVGAAIAGSAIWRELRRDSRRPRSVSSGSAETRGDVTGQGNPPASRGT